MKRTSREKPPGLINEDTLEKNALRVVSGSDETVYSKEKIDSAAWMI